uniref:Uncharacterized protein n=1 Tax=Branchiostoma floridae TaxID=7739 RepID=C3XY22_BRAFL|eukprot:XP_002611066.1 hypothetical protein BRAFLDRAFT_70419 [Branchiostoma floridae]
MGFWVQLKLLLWKNFTLRKRQKVRLLIEIIWPLILFMILVWIRTSRPPYSQHECHYPSKALPSAGLIPFMQTLICNFDNKCYDQPLAGEAPGRVFEFKDSPLSQLYFDIDELLSNDTELLGLENLVEDYQALQELVEFFNNRSAVVHQKQRRRDAAVHSLRRDYYDGTAGALAAAGATVSSWVQLGPMKKSVTPHECGRSLQVSARRSSSSDKRNSASWAAVRCSSDGLKFADMLVDVDRMERFLRHNLSLAPDIVTDLITAELNPQQAVQMIFTDRVPLRWIVCNETLLGRLIIFTNPSVTSNVTTAMCGLSAQNLTALAREFQRDVDWSKFLEEIFNFVQDNTSLDPAEAQARWNATFQRLRRLSEDIGTLGSFQSIINDIQNITSLLREENGTIPSLGLLVCGREDALNVGSFADNMRIFTQESMQSTQFRDYFDKDDSNDAGDFAKDNRTTPFCQKLFHQLDSQRLTKFLWSYLKPLLAGKIPYSPNTPAVRKILQEANSTFQEIGRLEDFADTWLTVLSPEINETLTNSDTVNFIRDYLSNPLFAEQFDAAMEERLGPDPWLTADWLVGFLGGNTTSGTNYTWVNAIEETNSAFQTLLNYLQCLELNKFEPMETEEDVTIRGHELIADNTLWAGIVFSNMNDDPGSEEVIPPHVEYKIRMDIDVVTHTTRIFDRYWRPGARDRPFNDMAYIRGGFVYLQDMIDQGIIRALTGKDEEPITGVYLQQFPYPCYTKDS